MKNFRYCKALCLLLSMVLLLSSVPLSVIAWDMTETQSDTGTAANSEATATPVTAPATDQTLAPGTIESETREHFDFLKPGEKTIEELQAMTVDLTALPEVIRSDVALEKGHVNRLKVQEKNLNTVIYQNDDGTKSTYIFARPVKYIDDSGEVKDKSSKVSAFMSDRYSYAMLENSTKVYFPTSAPNGTLIQYEDYSILMAPKSTVTAVPTYQESSGAVMYNGVFGVNTVVVYHTELNGLKEDIVLVKNIGKNEFDFELRLTDLTPVQADGKWYLQNSQGEYIGEFGEIIVKDSAGNTTVGSMTVTATAEQGKYNVTVKAPEAFLNAASTVYPVYVDPTTYIWETGGYTVYESEGSFYTVNYNAITDTGVYDNLYIYEMAQANPATHCIGQSCDGTGMVVYRFYDFFGEHGAYKNLPDAQIGSAQLYVNTVVYDDTTITAYPVSASWLLSGYGSDDPIAIEETGLWSVFSTNNSSSVPITAGTDYELVAVDVTQIVKGWARYNEGTSTNAYENPANGLMLHWGELSIVGYVKSVESSAATDNVYMVLDTGTIGGVYYINNLYAYRFLRVGSNDMFLNASIYEDTDYIRWHIEYLGNNRYCIRSMYDTTKGLLAFDSGVLLALLPTELTDQYIWIIQNSSVGGITITSASSGLVLRYNGTAVNLISPLSSSDANYRQTVWGIVNQSSYVHLTDFELSDNWLLPSSSKNFSIKEYPEMATWSSESHFTWSFSNSVFTVNDSGVVTSNASGGYDTLTVTHKSTGLTKTFRITSGAVREGTYMFMNKGNDRYMDIEGASTASGAYVQLSDFHTNLYAKWSLTILSNGGYAIQSSYSGLWLKAGNDEDADAIIQYSTTSDLSAQWIITQTTSGNYKISPSNATDVALAIPLTGATVSGSNLMRIAYTDDSSYRDEWCLEEISFMLYGITNAGHDHLTCLETVKNSLIDADFEFLTLKSGAISSDTCKADLKECHVFTSRSHGATVVYSNGDLYTTGIVLDDKENSDNSARLYAHLWSNLNANSTYLMDTDSFNSSGLLVFIGCNTASGGDGARNLPTVIVQKGAKAAIGFEESISCNKANNWTLKFYERLLIGENITQAAEYASSFFDEESGLKSFVICGDETFKIK